MSIALVASASCLYSAAQDRSLSSAGNRLRESLEGALAPPRPTRTDEMLSRFANALRLGVEKRGVMVGTEPLGRAYELLASLPLEIPLPEIVVESEREIAFDWDEGSRRVLSVTVDDTTLIGFAALLGYEPLHGRMPFAGETPPTLTYLFSRLYSHRHSE